MKLDDVGAFKPSFYLDLQLFVHDQVHGRRQHHIHVGRSWTRPVQRQVLHRTCYR